MGEAGAEAILPLRRGRDGRLGVAANANASEPGLMADLVQEVRALRAELADLRRQQAGEHRDAMGQGVLLSQRLGARRAAGGRG
jgi:phage-related minor tail protein